MKRIYLIGEENSLAGALSYVFEREVHSKCTIMRDGESIMRDGESISAEDLATDNGVILFMIDFAERDFERELSFLHTQEKFRQERITAALFNVQTGTGIERKAFDKGIKGIFYRKDSLPHVVKGVRSLLEGELWISRDVLVEAALRGRVKKVRLAQHKAALTRREVDVLALLSAGSTNDEIGEKLFISPNTVKTHLYRIFRKIKVPNRFQAALWAAKNL
jgi:LuxR family transcriptional regulator, positive regulator of biofilm formation